MILTDILKAGNQLLQSHFEGTIKVYGKEVIDGYTTPAFFTEVVTSGIYNTSVNYRKTNCEYMLTYFPKKPDSVETLNIIDELQTLFGKYLEVGNRKLLIRNIDIRYVGEKNDILQMSFDFGEITIFTPKDESDYDTAEVLSIKEV